MTDHTDDIPSITFTAADRQSMGLSQERQAEMAHIFEAHGCVRLEGVFAQDWITQLHRDFVRCYRQYLVDQEEHTGALRVGDRRWMVTLKLNRLYCDALLYANPLVYPLIQALLGNECIINSAGVVVALPGAKAQHDHRDLPALFDDRPIDGMLPCYAVTMMVPLIDCDQQHGTTQMRPGSHVVSGPEAKEMPIATPDMPVGSCVLMDYRLQHGGTANPSLQPRPLLYLVYSRPWFRDYRNFKKQAPLWLTRAGAHKIPAIHQHLFAQARRTWW